jgi:RecG-like helicase
VVAVLKGLRRKINESIDEIEEQRLAGRVADFALTPIAEAPLRVRITIAGEVQSVQVVPHLGSPSLEITVSDGSGRAAAVFTGRRRLGGVDCGRRVLLEGVARQDRGRLLVVNPAYTIVE